ncbi:MAG: hypothetical protein RBR22_02545 [Desulfuromonas sp.]|nr:hypothetical protein [Desulfuromonas sp.]
MLNWSNYMHADEQLVWQGRPAPRCFTFRRWRQALFGLVLLLLCCWWQYTGWQMRLQGADLLWCVIPLPFMLLSAYICCGQLLLARWEWERVFYALTSAQILVQCGKWQSRIIAIPLAQLNYQCMYPLGEHLGDLYLEAGNRRLTLRCVEQPHQLYELLKVVIEANQSADRVK